MRREKIVNSGKLDFNGFSRLFSRAGESRRAGGDCERRDPSAFGEYGEAIEANANAIAR